MKNRRWWMKYKSKVVARLCVNWLMFAKQWPTSSRQCDDITAASQSCCCACDLSACVYSVCVCDTHVPPLALLFDRSSASPAETDSGSAFWEWTLAALLTGAVTSPPPSPHRPAFL